MQHVEQEVKGRIAVLSDYDLLPILSILSDVSASSGPNPT